MDLLTLGTILIAAGFAIMAALAILTTSTSGQSKAHGGAVVIVGPFPIIFGSDKRLALVLVVLSIGLVGLVIVLFLLQGFPW